MVKFGGKLTQKLLLLLPKCDVLFAILPGGCNAIKIACLGNLLASMVSTLDPRPRDCHTFSDLHLQGLRSCLRRHVLTLFDDLVRKLLQQLPWMVPKLRICPSASAVCLGWATER